MSTEVKAPMVGKILSVKVDVGQKVSEDDEMFIMEAMKMEIPVGAPAAGTVKNIAVSAGASVESDQVLATIE
ncbi:MAG TPA: acetyl-CoA carboxylase biotin carboxyl carrier protein subunit [Thermodesulfobacteriota bacterium]|nr:acetyl-CoA carboxylase biotin carboxyl carrier protein subunit [Thermodesulfobacteriota bacterium]HNU71896.1 acetyl-CoA carboxylase biotin carboxyl carrier protein subunit [Thermodesulfobacteriota bacterium]